MVSPNQPRLLALVLIVVVAGAFVGLATAHDADGDQSHDDCEMNHGEDCQMMGGMMNMGDDCSMSDGAGMMDMHSDSTGGHGDCPMH